MFMRIFLLSMLVLSATAQAQDNGSIGGYGYEGCPRDNSRYQERGRGNHRYPRDRYRQGMGYRGPRMGGGRYRGRHGWWDIPVQEAHRLNPIEVSQQSLDSGAALYRDNCTRCHGDYGFGDGPQARDLRVPPPHLRHATRHYSDGELFYIISKGRDPMPSWEGKLSEEERWNLINYLRFEIGAHRGPRFGNCNNRYRPCDAVTNYAGDQRETMQDEPQSEDATEHHEMHEESDDSHHEEAHHDQHDE